MNQTDFYKLFIIELRDLYSAETQLLTALPQMTAAVTTPELKTTFNEAMEQTQSQINRLREVFTSLKEKPEGEKCEAMKGLIEESRQIAKAHFHPIVTDAAMIGALQRIMHYGIAGYGIAKAFAKNISQDDAFKLLKASINEKGHLDKALTSIAEGGFFTTGINAKAKTE